MKVKDVIERLQELPEDYDVEIFDPDSNTFESVSGCIVDHGGKTISLCSDDLT